MHFVAVVVVVVLCVCCDLPRSLVAFFFSRENFPLAAGLLATCHLPLATCLLPRLLNAFLMRASICARCVPVAVALIVVVALVFVHRVALCKYLLPTFWCCLN